MLQALLWDVDGTLAETELDGHRVAFNQAFEALGLPWRWDEPTYIRLLAVTGGRERLHHDLASRADAPPPGPDRDGLVAALHAEKNRRYAALAAEGRIALRAGVRELIDEAAAAGVRQAIVTTTSRVNVQALLAAQLGPWWSERLGVQVCGEDVAAKKPDPQAHRLALRLLGLDAAATLAIEDSPAGVAAAHAAGVPVLVTRSAAFWDEGFSGALAVGPGLDRRQGWQPPASRPDRLHRPQERITLDDLRRWHAG